MTGRYKRGLEIVKKTVSGDQGEISPAPAPVLVPPLAAVLMFNPMTGQLNLQWPPEVPAEQLLTWLDQVREAVARQIRARNGGLILPNGG